MNVERCATHENIECPICVDKAEIERLRAELEKADDRWRQAVERAELFCAERDRLAAKNVNLNILLKDICDEWNEGCDPACDSFGHTDTCKGANIAQAKRAMRDEIERLRAELAECKRDVEIVRFLRCGGWEVLQNPKYWTLENKFYGAIAEAMAEVAAEGDKNGDA